MRRFLCDVTGMKVATIAKKTHHNQVTPYCYIINVKC